MPWSADLDLHHYLPIFMTWCWRESRHQERLQLPSCVSVAGIRPFLTVIIWSFRETHHLQMFPVLVCSRGILAPLTVFCVSGLDSWITNCLERTLLAYTDFALEGLDAGEGEWNTKLSRLDWRTLFSFCCNSFSFTRIRVGPKVSLIPHYPVGIAAGPGKVKHGDDD